MTAPKAAGLDMADPAIGERLARLSGMRPWWPLVESSPRWIRVRLHGELIADSRDASLFVQYGPGPVPRTYLPTYFVPSDDLQPGVLTDRHEDDAGLTTWTVQAGGRRVEQGAWMHTEPPAPLEALAGLVTFSWRDLTWFEEEEELMAHARDPHKRVDVVPSSRHVQVELEGQVLAESSRPLVLFETSFSPRYYLPREDVVAGLQPSGTSSICPYKGVAEYFSVRVGDRLVPDLAWCYPQPIPENPRIAGLVCFFNEKVDLVVDGERLERPVTPWS